MKKRERELEEKSLIASRVVSPLGHVSSRRWRFSEFLAEIEIKSIKKDS